MDTAGDRDSGGVPSLGHDPSGDGRRVREPVDAANALHGHAECGQLVGDRGRKGGLTAEQHGTVGAQPQQLRPGVGAQPIAFGQQQGGIQQRGERRPGDGIRPAVAAGDDHGVGALPQISRDRGGGPGPRGTADPAHGHGLRAWPQQCAIMA